MLTHGSAQRPQRPDTTAPEAQALVDDLRSWPFVRVERRGHRALLLGARAGDLLGTLDLRTGLLAVHVGAGAQLEVRDRAGRRAAEALIRRVVDRERFAFQALLASP
jgi:hypothetical protein